MSESEKDELFAALVEGQILPSEAWPRAMALGIDPEEFHAAVRFGAEAAKERARQSELDLAWWRETVVPALNHHGVETIRELPPEVADVIVQEGMEIGAVDENGEIYLGDAPTKYAPRRTLGVDEDHIKRAARVIDKAVQRAAKPPEWRGFEYDPEFWLILDENARIRMKNVRRESLDRWQRWNTITFQNELDHYKSLEGFDLRSSIDFMNALAIYWAETQYHATRRQHMDTDELTLADVERLIAEARETDE
ncbi:MAG: hypothetical protein M3454_00845 [Actinomycetota bacterium]|nr:hypothetical protein [Actinomycetota bacterium]